MYDGDFIDNVELTVNKPNGLSPTVVFKGITRQTWSFKNFQNKLKIEINKVE